MTKLWLSLYIIQAIYCHFLRKFSELFFSVFTIDTHDFPGGPIGKFQHFHLKGRKLDPWFGSTVAHAAQGGAPQKSSQVTLIITGSLIPLRRTSHKVCLGVRVCLGGAALWMGSCCTVSAMRRACWIIAQASFSWCELVCCGRTSRPDLDSPCLVS